MKWLRNPDWTAWLAVFHAAVFVAAATVLILRRGDPVREDLRVVVVPIEGVIRHGGNQPAFGETAEDLARRLRGLAEDDRVKAVVLRINSPGGSVGAVQEIYNAVREIKGKGKPVVSSFGDVSASGGYYVACGGDRIVANPGTLTGSIGVVIQLPNLTRLMDKVGFRMDIIKTGDMKDAGSPFRSLSEAERRHFRAVIDDAYEQFLAAVMAGRGLSREALKPLADGRIFSGAMAKDAKLVDDLGDLHFAIEKAKEMAGLKDRKPRVIYQREQPGLGGLLRRMTGSPLDGLAESISGPSLAYLMS